MFSTHELSNLIRRIFYGFIKLFAKPFSLIFRMIGKYIPVESLISYLRTLPDYMKIDIRNQLEVRGKLDYEPLDVFLKIESNYENHTRTRSVEKEPNTVKWLEEFVLPGDVFYDIGANIGAYSLIASKIRKGDVKVYAFEPAFPSFNQLCNNVLINDCQDSIIPLQLALSAETCLEHFNYYSLDPGRAFNSLGDASLSDGNSFSPVYIQNVISYKIDDLISQFGLPIPNHIKIDVDGFEIKVLKGANNTLASDDLKTLLIEVDEANETISSQVKNLLSQNGFMVQEKHKSGGQINYYLFIRKDS